MNTLDEYLQTIKNEEHSLKMSELIKWVSETFPQLKLKIAWNQPMFTDHDTFIIGFSVSTKHISVAPEKKILDIFVEKIVAAQYSYSLKTFRILWQDPINYDLLKEMIEYSIKEKKDCLTFWLKD